MSVALTTEQKSLLRDTTNTASRIKLYFSTLIGNVDTVVTSIINEQVSLTNRVTTLEQAYLDNN